MLFISVAIGDDQRSGSYTVLLHVQHSLERSAIIAIVLPIQCQKVHVLQWNTSIVNLGDLVKCPV